MSKEHKLYFIIQKTTFNRISDFRIFRTDFSLELGRFKYLSVDTYVHTIVLTLLIFETYLIHASSMWWIPKPILSKVSSSILHFLSRFIFLFIITNIGYSPTIICLNCNISEGIESDFFSVLSFKLDWHYFRLALLQKSISTSLLLLFCIIFTCSF